MYVFHIFLAVHSSLHGFIWNQHNNQSSVGLLAQLVERCTGITRGHGFKSRTGLNFFRPYFHYCSCSAHHCEDHFHLRKESLFWPNQHSKNNIYLRVAVSFNTHLKVFRLKVRQTGEQDLTTNFKRKLFMSEVQPIKVKKKGNNFFVWNVIYAIYLDAFISNITTL